MRVQVVLAFAASAAAYPSMNEPRQSGLKPHVPAGPDDSRGPCPMMNTLANHGYLPHDGKNITVQNIGDAVFAAVNWSKDFGLLPGANVFRALGGVDRIDLHDLFNRTAGIERPASLARPDDSEIRSPERVREVLADSEDPDYITAVTLAHSRNRLEDIAPLTPAQQAPAQGEAAFIMLLMMDGQVPAAGEAEIDYSTLKAVKDRTFAFLAEERLAEDLGWKPNERVVQFADLAPMTAAIKAAQEAEE